MDKITKIRWFLGIFENKVPLSKIVLRPAFSLTRHNCDLRKYSDQSNHTIVNLF